MNVQGSGGGASRVQPPRLLVTAYNGLSRIAHRGKVVKCLRASHYCSNATVKSGVSLMEDLEPSNQGRAG
jgi:hypothetical protein